MIKDYSGVPVDKIITNNTGEDKYINFLNVPIELKSNMDTIINVRTSEELALLDGKLREMDMNNSAKTIIPYTLDYTSSGIHTIPGTFSKIIFKKEVIVHKTTTTLEGFMGGNFFFTINGKKYMVAFVKIPGSSCGCPEVGFVTVVTNPNLDNMPKNRAGVLYVLKSQDTDTYTMELMDDAFAEYEGVITDVYSSGPINDYPIELGYLVK